MENFLLRLNDCIFNCGIQRIVLKLVNLCGPLFVIGFYYLIYYHIHVFCAIIIKVLFKRVGLDFSMLWMMVGGVLGFNVVFNYTMAMLIKANGPTEVRLVEKLR